MLELCEFCVSLERLNWIQVTYETCPVRSGYLGPRDFAGADSEFPLCICIFLNVTQILSSVLFLQFLTLLILNQVQGFLKFKVCLPKYAGGLAYPPPKLQQYEKVYVVFPVGNYISEIENNEYLIFTVMQKIKSLLLKLNRV